MLIRTLLEILAVGAVTIMILHEETIADFEQRIINKIKNKIKRES